MTRTILVAGASGWLGRKIAFSLLDTGGGVRLMLRGGVDHPKAKDLAGLVERGARIVPGDVTEPGSLSAALEDVCVIVSGRHVRSRRTSRPRNPGIRHRPW